MAIGIEALTFDWYGTLATHRGKGRSSLFLEFLALHDLQSLPWDRRVLYDVFVFYSQAYGAQASEPDKLNFWAEFMRRLFERFEVRGTTANRSELHATAIRNIFGPNSFQLYPDVQPLLHRLKQQGLRLAVISNWHQGLDSFCSEMNLSGLFDAVIASADVGFEKPDRRIFNEAACRLSVKPHRITHVGDSPNDDFSGAVAAGFRAILIDRSYGNPTHPNRIESFAELEERLDALE